MKVLAYHVLAGLLPLPSYGKKGGKSKVPLKRYGTHTKGLAEWLYNEVSIPPHQCRLCVTSDLLGCAQSEVDRTHYYVDRCIPQSSMNF